MERQLSGRKFPLKIRTWEWGSMRALAAQLEMYMQEVYSLRFFYSFQIPRLGKEFDLLQIKDNHIVNIELKSGVVSDQAIRKQLIQNRYYLSVLGRPIQSYTYISSQNRLVRLTHHDHIVDADWERLCEDLQKEGMNYEGNIEDLFRAELYLISPITDPVRFLKKEYFLTSQQRDIEKKILRDIYAKRSGCFWFSGIPGTGKTLLLYDIAMKLSVRHRICMVHCEENGEKWRILHERLQRIDFLADEQIHIEKKSGSQNSGQDKGPDSSQDYDQRKQFNCEERKAGTQIPLEKYRGILVDEAHLLSKDKIERLLELSKKQPVIFSSDSEDVISSEEMDKENIKKLENQTDIKVFRLTNRIRTNAELSTFIQNMMHLPPRMNSRGYPHIFVVYANDDVEAENLLSDYIKHGYQWVEIEESERQEAQADLKMQAVRDMDKIVLLLDERYYYDEEGYLRAACFMKNGSSYVRKIFHRLNHAKESIALVVKKNEKVYNTLLELL
nr:DNA/RNA helicase domain-containing protein [Anaerobutyricum soehngenii]